MSDDSETTPTFGVCCGACGGPLFMATCHNFRGTGHEWVICSVCEACRGVHWTGGCEVCDKDPRSIDTDYASGGD